MHHRPCHVTIFRICQFMRHWNVLLGQFGHIAVYKWALYSGLCIHVCVIGGGVGGNTLSTEYYWCLGDTKKNHCLWSHSVSIKWHILLPDIGWQDWPSAGFALMHLQTPLDISSQAPYVTHALYDQANCSSHLHWNPAAVIEQTARG